MVDINPSIWTMSKEKDGKYTFLDLDGYASHLLHGTIKEIAYQLFQSYLNMRDDGHELLDEYGYITNNKWCDPVGPFWMIDFQKDGYTVGLDFLAKIEPEPEEAFWQELRAQVDRYMKLIIFS